jgi:hypothetical protein
VLLQRHQLAKNKALSEIDALCTAADRLPPGKDREALVRRIEQLNVEYQVED